MSQNSGELEDRVAIVTGGASGIGRACVERLLGAGAGAVMIADIDEVAGQRCLQEIGPDGERLWFERTDVSDRRQVEALVSGVVSRHGTVDILINSAGIAGRTGPMETHSEEVLDRIWAVNVKGTYFTCQAVHPHMVASGYGRIVNIASIAGKEGNPGLVPYSMTKAAVIGFTKAYAREVATAGILVHSVAPAVIETEILRQVSEEVRAYMVSKIPMGRVGRPREVAEMVLFLASDRCTFSTGACFDISGGRATY